MSLTSEEVARCLSIYSSVLGQAVNFTKSDVCFGRSVSEESKQAVAASLGVPITPCHKKYLGLPTFTGLRTCELFAFARDRVWEKINYWRGI